MKSGMRLACVPLGAEGVPEAGGEALPLLLELEGLNEDDEVGEAAEALAEEAAVVVLFSVEVEGQSRIKARMRPILRAMLSGSPCPIQRVRRVGLCDGVDVLYYSELCTEDDWVKFNERL